MRKPKLQGFGSLSIVSSLGKVDKPGLKSDPPEKPSFSTLLEVSPNSLHVGLESMKSTHISSAPPSQEDMQCSKPSASVDWFLLGLAAPA